MKYLVTYLYQYRTRKLTLQDFWDTEPELNKPIISGKQIFTPLSYIVYIPQQ